jgi:threonine dehydrogenase-like Zn-dependent dehydrogenase
MKGVVLPGNRQLEIKDFPVPKPGHGQVLIEMKASALCGSDLRAIYRPMKQGFGPEAYQGVIAGHEPCGKIVKVGPGVKRFREGDRVVVYHIAGCGLCRNCRSGWMISCTSPTRAAYGWQRDGGHADFMLADERTLIPLPGELTYVDGSLVACGLGTVYGACKKIGVSGRDIVLITGLGPVGLGAILLLKAMGAKVIGIEPVQERAQLGKQLGLDLILEPGEEAMEKLMEFTEGNGVEAAIDCSGSSQARKFCLEASADWGRVVFVGEGGTVTFEPSPLLIHKQLKLYGSWVCSLSEMEELVNLLVRWRIHPERIVTHRFSLDQTREAYELFDLGWSGKIVIVWD